MKKYILIIVTAIILLGIIIFIFILNSNKGDKNIEKSIINTTNNTSKNNTTINNTTKAEVVEIQKDNEERGVINIADISSTATFYTYTFEGVKIRMFAVKATDGTVRTAFNTCQVCNPSPEAYFVQKGSNFECQNCGNLFATNKIGLEKGGCNPIPITKEDRKEETGTIIIDKSFITQYKENFETIE